MPANAYSYVRMSTDAQLKGDSLRRQKQLSKNYAEKHGLNLVDDFQLEDTGISAFHGNNLEGALGRFLTAVKAGAIPKGSYLLVESLDRISRQKPEVAVPLFFNIVHSGIIIVTLLDEQIYRAGDLDSDTIRRFVNIMDRGHEESQIKAQRVSLAWEQKRNNTQKQKLTKKCPAWLRLTENRLTFEVLTEKANIVKWIFDQAVSGKGSYIITKELNRTKTPHLAGARSWSLSYVTKILNNRAVLGEFQPHTKASSLNRVGCPLLV